MATYGVSTNPILMPGNVEPATRVRPFIGIGVDHTTDTQLYNDATVAYRNACLNAGLPDEVRLQRRAGLPFARRRPDRGRVSASWTSRTRAARCTFRRQYLTSISSRRPLARSRPTGELRGELVSILVSRRPVRKGECLNDEASEEWI